MDNSILLERQKNIQSLATIPAKHISDEERAAYIERASDGEDVYAYGHDRLKTDNFINVWDIDTRIAYGPLAGRWYVRSAFHDGTLWTVTLVSPANDHQQVTIRVNIAPPMNHETHYETYAARIILSLVNHCSTFGLDPITFENSNH